jgi:predicted metal-dependent hydrolase
MTDLTVRRLQIDLEVPFDRHWCGGDAFRTALFNALSMSFPAGEQLFIDAVKKGLAALPPERREAMATEVQGFVGQEATHRRVHERFNAHLVVQGLVNHWEPRILARRRRLLEPVDDARPWAGATAATEHWTAIFAQHLLAQPWLLEASEPRLAALWEWHSAEELEHRSTAFDLYRALGGNEVWRRRLFYTVSLNFVCDATRQTVNNLWHDGTLFKPSTWVSAWRTLFGRRGFVRCGYALWREYLRADFHPLQGDGSGGERWLSTNASLVPPVRRPA